MKYLLVFLLFFTACSKKMESPLKHEVKIEMLFKHLMLDNYFAYTLFGEKPLTFYGKFHEASIDSLIKPTPEDLFFQNWEIWKSKSYKTPNYTFIEYDDGEFFSLIFVNKKNVINLVSKHIDVFQEHYQRNILPEEVLEIILNTKNYFEEFSENELIYGLLFGFGYTNSKAFDMREKGHFYLQSVSFHDEPYHSLYQLPLPYFLIFKSNDEVFELRKNYEKERRKIIEIYSKGNFLDITLKKLITE